MGTTKVSTGEMIAGASALALFVFMFLPWYGVEASTSLPGGNDFSVSGANVNAWEAFQEFPFDDILLFLVVLIVIGVAVGITAARATGSLSDLPQPLGLIVAVAGAFALLLILFRLIFTPGEGVSGFGVEIEMTRKIGIFFGLLASAGIVYGGWRSASGSVTGPVAPEPPSAKPPWER